MTVICYDKVLIVTYFAPQIKTIAPVSAKSQYLLSYILMSIVLYGQRVCSRIVVGLVNQAKLELNKEIVAVLFLIPPVLAKFHQTFQITGQLSNYFVDGEYPINSPINITEDKVLYKD